MNFNELTGQRQSCASVQHAVSLVKQACVELVLRSLGVLPAVGDAAAVAAHPQAFLQVWGKA